MRRALLAALLLASSAGTALANTRLPATTSVSFRKSTPTEIVLGSTIGLLISQDSGAHFEWICDNAVFGNNSDMFDPDYHVARDGTIYANTQEGIAISRDAGCTFDDVILDNGLPHQKWIDGMDLGPDDEAWITQAENGMTNDVYESTDAGQHWTSKGLSSAQIWWKTVKVAPTNRQRVYVSGYQVTQVADDGGAIPPVAQLLRSDDEGAHWAPLPTTDFAFSGAPVVLLKAVSPTNPDIVFAVSQGANPPMGDKLYRSLDGGATWQFQVDAKAPIGSVVFLQDGSVLAASVSGVWQAPTPDGTFVPLPQQPDVTKPPLQPQMACAGQREDGTLYACGANWDPDFAALGKAAQGQVGGWTKVFRFVDMAGPLKCPVGTVQHDTCELVLWPMIKEQFGIKDPIVDGAPADAPPIGMKKPTGCCESGGTSGLETALVILLAVVIGGLLVRRGKRKKKCCS
jgi:photosystem II stability/assembly factor-like uncharacterized protein